MKRHFRFRRTGVKEQEGGRRAREKVNTHHNNIRYTILKNALKKLREGVDYPDFPFGERLVLLELRRLTDKKPTQKISIPYVFSHDPILSPHKGWNFSFSLSGDYLEKHLPKVKRAFEDSLTLRDEFVNSFLDWVNRYKPLKELLEKGRYKDLFEAVKIIYLCKLKKGCDRKNILKGDFYDKINEIFDDIKIDLDPGIVNAIYSYKSLITDPSKVKMTPSVKDVFSVLFTRPEFGSVAGFIHSRHIMEKMKLSSFSLDEKNKEQSIHLGYFDFEWISALLKSWHTIRDRNLKNKVKTYFLDLMSLFGPKVLSQFTRFIVSLSPGFEVAYPLRRSSVFDHKTDELLARRFNADKKPFFSVSNFDYKNWSKAVGSKLGEAGGIELNTYVYTFSLHGSGAFRESIELLLKHFIEERVLPLYRFLDKHNIDLIRLLDDCSKYCKMGSPVLKDGNVAIELLKKNIPPEAILPDGNVDINKVRGTDVASKYKSLRAAFREIMLKISAMRLSYVETLALYMYAAKKLGLYFEIRII